MASVRNGVAVQIAREEKRALYIHCFARALNLAVADTITASNVCKDALDTAMEITSFLQKGMLLLMLSKQRMTMALMVV